MAVLRYDCRRAGQRHNLYSVVETCTANGVESYRNLVWLFTRLPLAATADDYADLMPWSIPAALNLLGASLKDLILLFLLVCV
ncbi:transposase domain-containing protein [Burkholderia territorii]|uniref:transposase domain-containing protein n=1 Tax=Burkholderia territorii TaxID=1503055 RepID=UPI0039C000F9